jgi:hypothetical protein
MYNSPFDNAKDLELMLNKIVNFLFIFRGILVAINLGSFFKIYPVSMPINWRIF